MRITSFLASLVKSPSSAAENIVQPTGDVVPLTVKGSVGHTANLMELQNSSGTNQAYIQSDGTFTNSSGNVSLGSQLLAFAGTSGRIQMKERASAPTGVADAAIIYAIDNGAGKTQLMAIFGTGAAQQIAIEP